MKTCLVIVDMQVGFMNEHTKHLPELIEKYVRQNKFVTYLKVGKTACVEHLKQS